MNLMVGSHWRDDGAALCLLHAHASGEGLNMAPAAVNEDLGGALDLTKKKKKKKVFAMDDEAVR